MPSDGASAGGGLAVLARAAARTDQCDATSKPSVCEAGRKRATPPTTTNNPAQLATNAVDSRSAAAKRPRVASQMHPMVSRELYQAAFNRNNAEVVQVLNNLFKEARGTHAVKQAKYKIFCTLLSLATRRHNAAFVFLGNRISEKQPWLSPCVAYVAAVTGMQTYAEAQRSSLGVVGQVAMDEAICCGVMAGRQRAYAKFLVNQGVDIVGAVKNDAARAWARAVVREVESAGAVGKKTAQPTSAPIENQKTAASGTKK